MSPRENLPSRSLSHRGYDDQPKKFIGNSRKTYILMKRREEKKASCKEPIPYIPKFH